MSKERKSNKEAKKAKKQTDGTKKQKKDPKKDDRPATRIVKSSNEQQNVKQ